MKHFLLTFLFVLAASSASAQAVVNMNIRQNPLFGVSTNDVSAVIEGTGLQLGADLVVTGGSGTYSYRWYTDQTELGSQPTLWVNAAADYFLDITDTCDCLQTVVFHVTGTAGIEAATALQGVRAFPNPTTGPVSLSAPSDVRQAVVFSEAGIMLQVLNGSNIREIDLSQLPMGRYILNIVTADGNVSSARIIKK